MGGTGRRRGGATDPRGEATGPARRPGARDRYPGRAGSPGRGPGGGPAWGAPAPPGAQQSRPRRDTLSSGREGPGLGDLWYDLPARTRRTAAGAVCLVLLAAGGYAIATQPFEDLFPAEQEQQEQDSRTGPDSGLPSATARRMPYPAQTARITFDRLAVTDRTRRTFIVELHAAATSPLTVLDVDQGYEAVDLGLAGRAAVPVGPGTPRTLRLEARVTNCDRVPFRARSPFLNVTLRNDRARQELSVIPGERYADALTYVFRTLCGLDGSASDPKA